MCVLPPTVLLLLLLLPLLSATVAREFRTLFEAATAPIGLCKAATWMQIDPGQLRHQLDNGTFNAPRLLDLEPASLERLLVSIAQTRDIPLVTRDEFNRFMRLAAVTSQPAGLRADEREKVSA